MRKQISGISYSGLKIPRYHRILMDDALTRQSVIFFFFLIFLWNHVFYLECSFSRGIFLLSNFRANLSEAVQIFGFPFSEIFCKPSILFVSSCSSPDSAPSYDILNLTDVANLSRILSRRVMHLISCSRFYSWRLVMIVSALVSMISFTQVKICTTCMYF